MIKKIIYILIIIGVLFGFYKLLSTPPTGAELNYDNPDLIFYWGDGCPHCKNVEDFIAANNVDQKVKINKKEIYKNTGNQKELSNLVNQYCSENLNNGNIGVPLAFDPQAKKCLQGDTPIIDFLSQKIK